MPIPSGPVPLGYGFRPFDEELITHLERKISGRAENEVVIAEIEFYRFDPWELPVKSKIKNDDPQWFFFYLNQPKYSSGRKLNRATKSGSWKPTGEDRNVISMESGAERVIGLKKTLVFCQGPTRESTSWTIHEYSSADNKDSYVVCRLFKNQEPKQRKKRKKAIKCSNDIEHAIESVVQLNQGTEEEFSAQPADEVNSVASLNVMPEKNDLMKENFDTFDDGVEINDILNPCKDNKEIIAGEAGNGEFPPMHSDNELLNENFASECYRLNRHNNLGASRILLRGESSKTSANVDTDDVGAENNEEVQQIKIYNEEALKCHAETRLADSMPYLGDNLMASQTVNTHDLIAETSKCYAALPDLVETNADEKGRGPRESTCWSIHECYSADNQLFKNQELKQRKKRKKAIECSNDTEHAIKSEVQLNQRTEDEFSVQPGDDVNLVASHATIPEESNFTSANSETQAPIPIESSNDAVNSGLSCIPRFYPWRSVSEMPPNQGNIKFLSPDLHFQPANEVYSVASHTVIQGESTFTSVNLDGDDYGTETSYHLQNDIARTHFDDNLELIFDDSSLNSAASHALIQEGRGVTSPDVDADDLGEEINNFLDAREDMEVPRADETVNDQSAIIHSSNEFADSLFNYDAASDCITENQIPETDFDSVTLNSSSSYNLRTTPSETQLIRLAGGDDLQVINEFVSEASTSQYTETGITLRPRGTRVSASDPSRQHQGTAPRRILLPSRCPLEESCERTQQPFALVLVMSVLAIVCSGFALVLVMSVLAIVYAGWKWFRG